MEVQTRTKPLDIDLPPEIFSLSHVAIPFPVTDSLYAIAPDDSENFNERLGTLAPRGERGTLILALDSVFHIASNPFFPYLLQRIDEHMGEIPPPIAASAPRTHETVAGQRDDFFHDLSALDQVGADEP